ncbi:BREX-6 system BrxE protein [Sorangium sp. So ce426]|uniref:BREX-6 system BrxE protein n=1 Tax=unclassified Sorangium TaxID=2621164 RepID=UPI003F5C9227
MLTNLDQIGNLRVTSTVRMATLVPDETLDAILAMQVTIAWAGEGRCSPRRLGWWDTDLIDDAGGGDLFARLLPQTHVWASLEAVREAARRTDAKARAKMADPDKLRTLYFLGFELDEQLGDRFAAHKRSGRPPAEVLLLPLPLTADFAKEKLVSALQGGDAAFTTVPGGRQLKGKRPDATDVLVRRLGAALVPLAEQYPLPFYKLEG